MLDWRRPALFANTATLFFGLLLQPSPGVGQVSVQAEKIPQNPAQSSSEFSPVDVRVPCAPTPVLSQDKANLVYELNITNFQPRDLTLMAIEVLSGVSVIASYRNAELTNALYRPGTYRDPADRRYISAGMSAVAFIWLVIDRASLPSALHHRLTFRILDPSGNGVDTIVDTRQVEIRRGQPLVITPPFRSGTWAAGNGPSNTSPHRRAFVLLDGEARIPQRFAFDWFKLGEKGKQEDDAMLVHDDPRKNENWYGYGTEIVAIADAVVAKIKDGIPDNIPLAKSRAVPITPETVAGNYVVLDLEDGHFALFAHLQPNSLRVKIGDKVRRGQTLGRLGDSGNSDSPHLHFHFVDGNAPLGAEGLPFAFESYEVLGILNDLGVLTRDKGWRPQPGAPVEKRSKEMPVENMIIRLP